MPPRLGQTRSRLGDVLIYDRGVDPTTDPIALHLDTDRKNFSITRRQLPTEAGSEGGIQLSEWAWQNGSGGAGTSIETPSSYESGACQHGEFVWLRRLGVAVSAGELTELTLPTQAAAMTTGGFKRGQVFGANNDLYITTAGRSIVKVPNGTGAVALTEQDCGSGAVTLGIGVFNGTGSSRLYVGDTQNGIWEFDGASWTEGEAGTERGYLEVPYWVLGDELATGGAASDAGNGKHRLVGTNATGTGFYHVAGDPQVSANWSSLATVGIGGTVFPINATVASNRVVWFGTGLGVLGANEAGYTPNLTKALELFASQDNCKAVAYWADLIWVATEQGLMAFKPSGERIDLPLFLQFGAKSGVTPIYGRPRALAPSEDGLYVGYYNEQTGVSYIGCLLMDPSGSLRWSMAEAVIEDEEVGYLQQVSGSDGNPRLFIGTIDGDGGLHLYWQSQPKSGDPEMDYQHDGPFSAAPAWSVTLSRFNGGRAVRKTARRWMLEADQLGTSFPNNAVAFQVANDGGAFTTQGTAQGSSVTLNRWNAQPRANTAQATSMQVKLVVTNESDAPVVIRTASVLYSSHPELSAVVTIPVIISEAHDTDPRQTLQRLERAQRAGPIAIDDYFGRRIEGTISVDLETIVAESKGNGYTIHADVTILYTRQASRFDSGDTWDGGYLFS
jgi:hypothetical protein